MISNQSAQGPCSGRMLALTFAALCSAQICSATMAAAQPAPTCGPTVTRTFAADGERVLLTRAAGLNSSANFAVFRAPLAVNTDGAPNSYHPFDPLGTEKAINRFDNGISIRRAGTRERPPLAERLQVFARWRDSSYAPQPGYTISWQNVIAARDGKPCVFTQGPFRGYFGSKTSLTNGLPPAQRGECQAADQLDQTVIPAIVLRGGATNPLWGYGAGVGDLVVAINPRTGTVVPALIGDSGDGNRIGEGSVALNMALLGRTAQPHTYADARALDTGRADMIVAVLPGSRGYQRPRTHSPENIRARVTAWAQSAGYASLAGLSTAIQACSGGL